MSPLNFLEIGPIIITHEISSFDVRANSIFRLQISDPKFSLDPWQPPPQPPFPLPPLGTLIFHNIMVSLAISNYCNHSRPRMRSISKRIIRKSFVGRRRFRDRFQIGKMLTTSGLHDFLGPSFRIHRKLNDGFIFSSRFEAVAKVKFNIRTYTGGYIKRTRSRIKFSRGLWSERGETCQNTIRPERVPRYIRARPIYRINWPKGPRANDASFHDLREF